MGRLLILALAAGAILAQAPVTVPFVGCKSDGQVGPMDAPEGKDPVVPIAAGLARRLAYYKAERGPGVFAPRGWYCFGEYGSAGTTLYVGPQPVNTATTLSARWNGSAGPAIEIGLRYGNTSGRFEVAEIIARVFPAHRAFVDRVASEGIIEPAPSFPSEPYPEDKLTYRSTEVVEYQTSAQMDGLGTYSSLLKNDSPIRGVAILTGDAPDLLLLSVRLPPDTADLTSTIIQQVEREAATRP